MQRFKNILIVVNDDGVSDVVLSRGKWLAQANGAKLTLLTVKETSRNSLDRLLATLPGKRGSDLGDRVDTVLQEEMEAIAAKLADDGAQVDCVLAKGVDFIEIIRQVLANGHDLVLKGAEQSFSWRTFGGADLHLLRKCPCPVWILKSGGDVHGQRIMAAVDPDPQDKVRDALSHTVMQFATSLAVQDDASLDVLNAWYLYEEQLLRGRRGLVASEEVDALVDQTCRTSRSRLDQLTSQYTKITPDMNVLHIKGPPSDVIVHHAQEQRIDTLIMGTLGRAGLQGLFIGNTAEAIITRVECSVLAVKPANFVSPVTL